MKKLLIFLGILFLASNAYSLPSRGGGSIILRSISSSANSITITSTDPALFLDATTSGDTDFYLCNNEDSLGTDDDVFTIGTGTSCGSNSLLKLDGNNFTLGTIDPTILLDATTSGDTDFYICDNEDSLGTDDDTFIIGTGSTCGSSDAFAITSNGDASFEQNVLINELNFSAATAGTDDNYALTLVPSATVYTTGLMVMFSTTNANSGAATLNINGLGAKSLKMLNNQQPADDYIESGSIIMAVYDGTNFQMIQPDANP